MAITASDEALLDELPRAVEQLMRPALLALDDPDSSAAPVRADVALEKALAAAQFPRGRWIDAPDRLDRTCRTMVELLASRPGVEVNAAFPRTVWARQRWLGLAPPTRAELPVDFRVDGERRRAPLYAALGELRERSASAEEVAAIFSGMSVAERLDAMGGLAFGAYRVEPPPLDLEALPADPAAWAGSAGWAAAFADRLTALWAEDVPLVERGNRWTTPEADQRRAIFLALARTGHPVEPRWDWLLPLGWDRMRALTEEVVALLPEPRRGLAIARSLEDHFSSQQLIIGRELLHRFPSLPFVEQLIAAADEARDELFVPPRRRHLAQLSEQLGDHPELREAIEAHLRGLPRLPVLRPGRVFDVQDVEDLTPSLKRQFDILGRGWEGDNQMMVSGPEDAPEYESIHGVTAYEILDEAGQLAYEALLHCSEDGAVCRAGTLHSVAYVSQRTLTCNAGDELLEALQEVLSSPFTENDGELDEEQ